MKKQVIADSGSTKTDWVLIIDNQAVARVNTQGLNPYYTTQEDLVSIVQFEVLVLFEPFLRDSSLDELHFYGAGCSVDREVEFMRQSLRIAFPVKEVYVYHDMLGAARALCQEHHGVACILGTGSNSCYYNGKEITVSRPAPGYILGDEGGGAFLGKQFIRDYVYGNFSDELKEYVTTELSLSIPDIYENIYKRQMPNRYLASFAVFIRQELEGDFFTYFHSLVEHSFQSFFDCHILRYENAHNVPIHAVGSIAYYFNDILENVAAKNGCKLGKVIKTPMEGLIEYHGS
jgi:glucosamine kinase